MRPSLDHSPHNRATILIVIIGICGLLTSLALAFISYVQQGATISDAAIRESQSRIMLHAGTAFILESARMGYGPNPRYGAGGISNGLIANSSISGSPLQHREGFGWIDIRDGSIGPKDQNGTPVWIGMPGGHATGSWPEIGGKIICPMYRWTRTRYAIGSTVSPNAIETDPTRPRYGYPFLNVPDPQPADMHVVKDYAANNGALSSSSLALLSNANALNSAFTAFAFQSSEIAGGRADSTPIQNSQGIAWFRVYRCQHIVNSIQALASTFIVTCGAGGTYGFRTWNEVQNPPSELVVKGGLTPPYAQYFDNSEAVFNSLRKTEIIAWYEIRWSASVKVYTNDQMYVGPNFGNTGCGYAKDLLPSYPFTVSNTAGTAKPDWGMTAQTVARNPINQSMVSQMGSGLASGFTPNHLGTISYIQRLDTGTDSSGNVGYIQPVRDVSNPQRVYIDW